MTVYQNRVICSLVGGTLEPSGQLRFLHIVTVIELTLQKERG